MRVIVAKRLQFPLLTGQPGEDAALDVGEVAGDEMPAGRRAQEPTQAI